MTTTAASRCVSALRTACGHLETVLAGFAGFLTGTALIGYHVVPMTVPGRIAAAAAALAVFAFLAGVPGAWLLYPVARWLPRRADPRHAGDRERYFQLDDEAGKLMRRLGREDDPEKRAALLDDLAAAEQAMADIYPDAFGPDPIEHENGRDLAESMALSAALLRVLAFCEYCLTGAPVAASYPDGFTNGECYLLGELTIVRDRMKRAELLDRLWTASVGRVGGQAAEVLVSLAYAERKTARRSA